MPLTLLVWSPTEIHSWHCGAACISMSPIRTGQRVESATDWAVLTDCCLFTDWTSSHARLADRLPLFPDSPIGWCSQSVLPIAIHLLLHRLYPLARKTFMSMAVTTIVLPTNRTIALGISITSLGITVIWCSKDMEGASA